MRPVNLMIAISSISLCGGCLSLVLHRARMSMIQVVPVIEKDVA